MMEDLSTKMRGYLAEVYRISDSQQSADGFITTSALAESLMVSPPAVNRMVNRLKEQGLLEHEPYQGIRLTEAGRREALQALRAHRIAEVFLQKVMNFSWEEVYHEAQSMSDALSDALIQRMAEMTANPKYCPHGEPIPQADGSIEAMNDMLLSDVEAGSHVQVTRMRSRDTDRLNYIHALGLSPNTKLDVIHKAPFNGPMQLKIGNEYRIVGHNLAELIRVRKTT
jgi:DtxR family transcriptional regulator, Mn-dependent transcriptional regulator